MPDKPSRIVVTGREGQVARALAERCADRDDIELIHAARPDFEMANPQGLAEKIAALEPDIVVNAAAYTAVDQAESEPELAMTINAVAAGEVARGASLAGAPIIQISTDYVFDGVLDRPYREDDLVNPLGVYGRTKLAGEKAAAAANPAHVILRTSWVYSPFGKNFVKTMLRLAETKDEIGVVADQFGNPTSAFVIADGLLAVHDHLNSDRTDALFGTYHLTGAGSASWFEFAQAAFEAFSGATGRAPILSAIGSADFPTAVKRPANSIMQTSKFEAVFHFRPPHWRTSLKDMIIN